jgi:hypothetical protein
MNRIATVGAAALLAAAFSDVAPASADQYLGSYVARISDRDHHASDGYELGSAAQMVRQDRAYWHKFGSGDPDDEGDRWFATNAQRERLQAMLERQGAMSQSTRRAIVNGEPLVQVDVYRNSVRVSILER